MIFQHWTDRYHRITYASVHSTAANCRRKKEQRQKVQALAVEKAAKAAVAAVAYEKWLALDKHNSFYSLREKKVLTRPKYAGATAASTNTNSADWNR
jgi:predicted dinucleotide-binding enzyme